MFVTKLKFLTEINISKTFTTILNPPNNDFGELGAKMQLIMNYVIVITILNI